MYVSRSKMFADSKYADFVLPIVLVSFGETCILSLSVHFDIHLVTIYSRRRSSFGQLRRNSSGVDDDDDVV